jgi:hypothetical protein
VLGFCEHGKEPSVFIKCGDFFFDFSRRTLPHAVGVVCQLFVGALQCSGTDVAGSLKDCGSQLQMAAVESPVQCSKALSANDTVALLTSGCCHVTVQGRAVTEHASAFSGGPGLKY